MRYNRVLPLVNSAGRFGYIDTILGSAVFTLCLHRSSSEFRLHVLLDSKRTLMLSQN